MTTTPGSTGSPESCGQAAQVRPAEDTTAELSERLAGNAPGDIGAAAAAIPDHLDIGRLGVTAAPTTARIEDARTNPPS